MSGLNGVEVVPLGEAVLLNNDAKVFDVLDAGDAPLEKGLGVVEAGDPPFEKRLGVVVEGWGLVDAKGDVEDIEKKF